MSICLQVTLLGLIKDMKYLLYLIITLVLITVFVVIHRSEGKEVKNEHDTIHKGRTRRSIIGNPLSRMKKFMRRTKRPRKNLTKLVRLTAWRKSSKGLMDTDCFSCLKPMRMEDDWECGHIVSHSHGGSDEAVNMQPLCRRCNRSMGPMNMYEYMYLKGYHGNLSKEHQCYFSSLERKSNEAIRIAKNMYSKESLNGLLRCLNPRKSRPEMREELLDILTEETLPKYESIFAEAVHWKKVDP